MKRDALFGAPWLKAMARVFDDAGVPLYIVGGAVRNPLMGLPLSDIDVCGPALPHEICALCEGTLLRTVLRSEAFGAVELHIVDEQGQPHMAEYTTWRTDSYESGHRPDQVRFTTDIALDARRRDFSINALYQRVHEDHLEPVLDPTGGLAHLSQGVLHTVTENPDEVLRNDGLRILRSARFQAELALAPTPSHMESLGRYAHLLADIAPERMREEIVKILMADLRYPMLIRSQPAAHSGLHTLHRIGAWKTLFGSAAYDPSAARALMHLPHPQLPARLALLLHASAVQDVKAALEHLRFPARDVARTLQTLQAMRETDLLSQAKLGLDVLETAHSIFAALGDEAHACRVHETMKQLREKPLSLKDLAVSGADLKPLFEQQGRPMREMGAVLEALWRAVLEEKAENARESLLQLLLGDI